MPSFLVKPESINEDTIILSGREYKHAIKVLRYVKGDIINVIDGAEKKYKAVIIEIYKNSLRAKILETHKTDTEPQVSITLFQSLIKATRFEMILEKATELGIQRIVPVITERSIYKSAEPGEKMRKRWQRILEGAACQCGRMDIPELGPVISFEKAVSENEQNLNILFFPDKSSEKIAGILEVLEKIESLGLFVGPEGGFSEKEFRTAVSAGIRICGLGSNILRAETAAIVSLAIVIYEIEKLSEKQL